MAQITARARMSRRTFYELFEDREACLLELVEDTVAAIEAELSASQVGSLVWRERVRTGLAVILSFFDREPALARVCVVEALSAGPRVLRRREELLSDLAGWLDDGFAADGRGGERLPLTAEGVVGAALAIVHTRVLRGRREPLVALTGELTAMIVLPYLGAAAARRERIRPLPVGVAGRARRARPRERIGEGDPLRNLPMRLTYRTALVLTCIAQRPGVSNRAVAEHAGVSDQGQISKLLARLGRLGLVSNTVAGRVKGEPNAWELTPLGKRVVRGLQLRAESHEAAA